MRARVQGEDVVSGIRTPVPVREMRSFFPGVYEELKAETSRLEAHMQNAQVGEAGGRGRWVQEGKTVTRYRLLQSCRQAVCPGRDWGGWTSGTE